MISSIFFDEFQRRRLRAKLERDAQTWWACDLSREHLVGVLWLAGEFRSRGHGLIELFDRHPAAFTLDPNDSPRARVGLELLLCHDAFDVAEATRRLTQARGPMQFSDLPDDVRGALERAAPETQWIAASMSEYGYAVEGSGGVPARVNCVGEPVVRLGAMPMQLPDPVSAALRRELPTCEPIFSYKNANARFDDYEILVRDPERDGLKSILVAGDGTRVGQTPRSERRRPIFSPEFRRELSIGKYTQWAVDLSEASLEGELWLLGAVASEILPTLKPVSAYVDLTPWPWGEIRPRLALEGILRAVARGEPFDVDRWRELLISGEAEWRRECRNAVPFIVRRALAQAVPEPLQKRMTGVDKRAEGYRFYAEDEKGGTAFTVTVTHGEAQPSVARAVTENEVPEPAMATLKGAAPGVWNHRNIWAIGPNWASLAHFRFDYFERGRVRSITVSADGTEWYGTTS